MEYKRIRDAVMNGLDAFWEEVAKAFPEIETGDLDAVTVLNLEGYLRDVVAHWIEMNK